MKSHLNHKSLIIRLSKILFVTFLLLVLSSFISFEYFIHSNESRTFNKVSGVPKMRVALVLGAGVRPDGSLSTLLRDRVDASISLYKSGKVTKLLMSGDNRTMYYNEPDHMREYAISHGIPAEDIVCDYAGRRTYDSIYRAKYIFGLDRFVIISQGFHLPRAIFLSDKIGVEAYGLSADQPNHKNMKAEIREMPACLSAIMDVYLNNPKPVMGKKERI